jgi:DNA-binding response OmpR family regulator
MTQPYALIIEDDRKLADIFSIALQTANFVTRTVDDGQLALTVLAEDVPDLVVLDMHLPHVSGRDILRQIRIDNRLKNTQVMVATADARLAETLRGVADLVLVKPVSIDQLIALASRLTPKP